MTSNQVDLALAADRREVGLLLCAAQEDQWFDRKSSKVAPKDLGAAMVAFANAEGGVIVIGIHNGRVEGIKAQAHKLNAFRQAAMDFTSPPVRAVVDQVSCVNERGEVDVLVVMRVSPSDRVHELMNGDCYLRVGDESRKLSFRQRQELEFDKGQSQYDGFVLNDVTIADLDDQLVKNYVGRSGATGGVESLMVARSLITPKLKQMTNAGYLLFGRHPQDRFPQAYIRVVKFMSIERGTGVRLGVDDDHDHKVEGAIPWAIQNATKLIEELVPKRRALDSEGRFEARPIVPRDAWLEGLVNAVVHRSYSLGGDHIRVEIYPDRIEIESPGRFPGLADPSRPLNISRFARNPRIARVCADLRIGQELGEGIRRIFDEMRRGGLTDPIYRQTSGSVRLLLASIPRLDPSVARTLPAGSELVLDSLRGAASPLSTGDLAELLGWSRPSMTKRLRALQDAGLIVWTGKSPKDPRAVWRLGP